MTKARTLLYPAIRKWLAPWLQQLSDMGSPGDYRVMIAEMEEVQEDEGIQERLTRLDEHIALASELCQGFHQLISEKVPLPRDLEEANKTVLNKLAEIRAVIGLSHLGFSSIRFSGSPDLTASLASGTCFIEVTRLGSSLGRRSDVWEKKWGSLDRDGWSMGTMHAGGRVEAAISEAIYRETEEKYRQVKGRGTDSDKRILWISLGRDYLTAGKYELPGVGVYSRLFYSPQSALDSALSQILATGAYQELSHVVLSMGRDHSDFVLPEISR